MLRDWIAHHQWIVCVFDLAVATLCAWISYDIFPEHPLLALAGAVGGVVLVVGVMLRWLAGFAPQNPKEKYTEIPREPVETTEATPSELEVGDAAARTLSAEFARLHRELEEAGDTASVAYLEGMKRTQLAGGAALASVLAVEAMRAAAKGQGAEDWILEVVERHKDERELAKASLWMIALLRTHGRWPWPR